MGKLSTIFFLGLSLIAAQLLCLLNPAQAQNILAFQKKKSASSLKSSSNFVADTIDRQKLFRVLKELSETRGIYFFISDASLGDIMVMPVMDEKMPVDKLLQTLLENTGLQFKKLNEKTYVIVPHVNQPVNFPAQEKRNSSTAQLQSTDVKQKDKPATKMVTGRVSNKQGLLMPGVSVQVKGTANGTTTNERGEFSIEAAKEVVLEFSSVGYKKEEVTASNAVTDIAVVLSLSEQQMNEVVVTALDLEKKSRAIGYSVNVISSNQLTSSGNTNFASALYGKAPGLRIVTAPGGATSAVQMQIRGVNSLHFNSQPLFIVDGVVIRNTNEKGLTGINNAGYWNDQRIRGNGILDINPADIESITILKGASATALYGSEAASGAVLITTKRTAQKPGVNVEVNFTGTIEKAAFLPKYQNVYGPGFDRITNISEGVSEDGWINVDTNGDGVYDAVRPNFNAYSQFGPKMDGRNIVWWDGKIRPYTPQPDNYQDLYRTGFSSIANAAVSNKTEKASYRFSYTRNDYHGIQPGGYLQRNTLNLNNSFKINDHLSANLVLNYINSKVHNRPVQLNRIIASYSGFLSRAERMNNVFDKYQTSKGYKWVPWNQQQFDPAEALRYNTKTEVLDFLWMQLRNSEDENEDRILSSFTLNYTFNNHFNLRTRFGNDFTALKTETKNYNEYPVAFNTNRSTGLYRLMNGKYSIVYGDAMLNWSQKVSKNISLSANTGYQARREKYSDQTSETVGGLLRENWFSLQNSYDSAKITLDRSGVLKYAFLGLFNVAYKNYLFLEGTARKEYSSTLPPGRNSYFYSSANSSFVFSDAFKMPSFVKFGKLRASYGLVGNAPPAYAAAITYTQTALPTANGTVAALSAQTNAGNNQIKPERKYEAEFGFESILFNNRFGIDFTYYQSRTVDQILQVAVPASTGADSKLVNSGELKSKGIEVVLTARPFMNRNFKWSIFLNIASDKTIVSKLANGVREINFYQIEQNAIKIVAEEGDEVGNIYVYPHLADNNGNNIVSSNGLYVMDNSRYKKVGNIMPKLSGGLSNELSYKQFALDVMIDYRIGGKMLSPPLKYNLGAGMYEGTLKYRDTEHGGLPYYIDGTGTKILLPSNDAVAPGNAKVYHDGMVLEGVTVNGKTNTTIIDAPYYYYNMFAWGAAALNEEGAVYNNSYVKMREAALSYTLPSKLAQKIHFNSLKFSLIGRNLLYIMRTLKNLDPEAPIGSNWMRQGIDEGSMASTRSYGFSLKLSF